MPPIKSISITTNRRGSAPRPIPANDSATDDSKPLQVALARPVRRHGPRVVHRFRIGERLRMNGGGQSIQRVSSNCKIVALLPYEGYGALLYRVRSDSESYERIVAEADLSRD